MMDYIYVGLYHLFRFLATATPDALQRPILRGIARTIHGLDRKHRHIARVNLDLAFGDRMSPSEKARIVRKTYENMVFNLAFFLAHQNDTPKEVLRYVTIEGKEHLDAALRHGPVILVTAHYGNWELLPRIFAAIQGPVTVVGRPLDSKKMDAILRRSREMFGIEMVEKRGAMKGLLHALRQGRNVGLLVDQNTSDKDGILIDFFGKKARHTPAAAILARGLGLSIVPLFLSSEDHRHFKLTIYPPIQTAKTADKESDIARSVQAQADITEKVIRQKPDEWFWLHQRWKNQYEHLYNKENEREG